MGNNQDQEKKIKATWDRSPEIRAEFVGDFEAYLAYAKAEEAGALKTIGSVTKIERFKI